MWIFIAILLVVQVIGLMTFLHFNSTVKKLKRENRRIKHMIDPEAKPNHEKLGMTKERYEHLMDVVYGKPDEQIRLYNPYAPKVFEDEEVELEYDGLYDEFLKPEVNNDKTNNEEDETEEKLSELLGIDDMNEIDRIQKEIEKNQAQHEVTPQKEKSSEKQTDVELEDLDKDLESLFENEVPEPEVEPQLDCELEEEPRLEHEPEEESEEPVFEAEPKNAEDESAKKPQKTNKGEGEALFNEIFTALNGEEPQEEQINNEPLFSDEIPVEYDTPFISGIDETIPVTDEDIPYIPEDEDLEQDKMISVLNLLDKENSRLEKETNENPISDKEERIQVLKNRLSLLAEQGEGKNHMKDIVTTLIELYQLEGKEDELKTIREEYKEYFTEEEIELRIFEEDIIRVDKIKENPFQIPEKYLWIATNSIADGKEGEQRWIGKCIGKNQNYIHFRDMSQRIWINVGKRIEQIEIGDLLAVFVERKEGSITAKEVLTLKEVAEQEKEEPVVC